MLMMLEVAEQAPRNVIKEERSKSVERESLDKPYQCSSSNAAHENLKKRWMRVRNALTLAKTKLALNNSTFSSAVRGKSKPVHFQNDITDLHTSASSRGQCNGNEWAEAFSALIKNPEGCMQFTKFLESEYSEENIAFWWAVEELHALDRNSEQIVKAVQDIYNTFIAPDSSLAINIDHDTRMDITERIVHQDTVTYTNDIFDKAQSHVYRLMEKDCFSRFVYTDTYNELSKRLKLPEIFQFGISM